MLTYGMWKMKQKLSIEYLWLTHRLEIVLGLDVLIYLVCLQRKIWIASGTWSLFLHNSDCLPCLTIFNNDSSLMNTNQKNDIKKVSKCYLSEGQLFHINYFCNHYGICNQNKKIVDLHNTKLSVFDYVKNIKN